MGKADLVATAERRVAKVVGIMGRDKARVDEIERAIQELDGKVHSYMACWPWPPYPVSKNDKSIARSLGRAFARLDKQLDRHDAGGVPVRAVYGGQDEFFEWRDQLKRWGECFEAFAGEEKAEEGTFLGPTSWPLGRPRPSAARFRRKHDAVEAAATILESHGLRLTATRQSSTQKASVFCRVSAVLAGGDPRSIYHQCRAFIKARNRVSR